MPQSRGKNVTLFGFKLTMTSALLLFISFSLTLFGGLILMYTTLSTYNETDYFPVVYFLVAFILICVSLYILIQTMRFRNKN